LGRGIIQVRKRNCVLQKTQTQTQNNNEREKKRPLCGGQKKTGRKWRTMTPIKEEVTPKRGPKSPRKKRSPAGGGRLKDLGQLFKMESVKPSTN